MIISLYQATTYAKLAGFTGSALQIILAIAQAESGLDTLARNTAGNTPPSLDRGIVQINSYWHSEVSDACAFDPACAFRAAYTISKQATDFTPWSTYTSGAYLKYMSTASASSGNVSWVQPGLLALPEKDGHGDSCAPIVILDYRHLHSGVPLDIATLDAERAELIRWGLMNVPGEVGMTLTQIRDALAGHYGITPIKFVDWNLALDINAFHQDIIQALNNHQLVIVEGHNAAAWPDNQAGVQNHFILLGGIDSTRGYAVCNGDTYAALASVNPSAPVWYNIGQLEAGQVAGYIILPAIDPVPTGGTHSMIIPQGWSDDGVTLRDPEGHGITEGFRETVGNWPGGWESDNHALSGSDDTLASVEYVNGAIGAGTRRLFRYRGLGWSKTFNNGQPYAIWLGVELAGREAEVAQLEAKVKQLQAQIDATPAPTPAPPPPPPPPAHSYASEVQGIQSAVDALTSALKANGED